MTIPPVVKLLDAVTENILIQNSFDEKIFKSVANTSGVDSRMRGFGVEDLSISSQQI